ncbi:unnamed protein product [Symbiodinium microadriaticum]|nr:unnamed protein product [Symbiodinium microadriaticum]
MDHVGAALGRSASLCLRPLLATPAVLDLAGGDVVLPTCPPELEEPEGGVAQAVKQAKRQLKLFKSAAEGECRFRNVIAQLQIGTGSYWQRPCHTTAT